MPPNQQYHCENFWSRRCPQFSNITVRTSDLADAPNSAIPLWEALISQMPPINNTTVRTSDLADAPNSAIPLWEPLISQMLPIQQYHCENLWSRRCSPFSNSTVIMSGLADAPNLAIPMWKGEISQNPPPPVYTWITCWPVSNHSPNSMVTSSQMFLVNFCPVLNSILQPEHTFSGMATGHLHN